MGGYAGLQQPAPFTVLSSGKRWEREEHEASAASEQEAREAASMLVAGAVFSLRC